MDYNALEAGLDALQFPRYRLQLDASNWRMRGLARAIARGKRRAARRHQACSLQALLPMIRPLGSSGGWISCGGPLDGQDHDDARKLVERFFAPKGLTVTDTTLRWVSMQDGLSGTFEAIHACFTLE